jgi:CubicO group peptidase (beta-lactamase class C family)
MKASALALGFVAPGYEVVRDAFSFNLTRADGHREVGASLCVYLHDACVVDLWGGHADAAKSRPWREDTLVNVWSTTKGITAIAIARLIERGLVSYERRVSELWPEFAAAGKRDITLAQVLSHRAGLPGFEAPTTCADLLDFAGCCEKLAAQRPVFEPGSASCYHTITFGYLAGEVVRRVAGCSLGSFVREELAGPLQAACYVGLAAALHARVADLVPPEAVPVSGQSTVLPQAATMATRNPVLDATAAMTPAWRNAEIPALNGHADARGVARLFAVVANRGSLEGTSLLSAATLRSLGALGGHGADLLLGYDPEWVMGLSRNPKRYYGPNPATLGHSGWGGSFGCADPKSGLAVGYVCNRMGSGMVSDPRGATLIESLQLARSQAS